MSDRNDDDSAESFGNLPILPTGSGVADLEVAYEQMKLSQDADEADITSAEDDVERADPAVTPTEAGPDAVESAAHPS